MTEDKESVWLIVHYDWEDSDVIAICKTRGKAYEIRKEYLKNHKGKAKSINVIERKYDTIHSIYGDV
jgi:cupin superfamily acireductone dioxygenase involved in methionine salvage